MIVAGINLVLALRLLVVTPIIVKEVGAAFPHSNRLLVPTRWGDSNRNSHHAFWSGRGGDASTEEETESVSLDEKVKAAMRKLGLTGPASENEAAETVVESEEKPPPLSGSSTESTSSTATENQGDVHAMVDRISKDMHVNEDLVMAAVGATSHISPGEERQYDEDAARNMIQQELNIIEQVSEDTKEVKQLVAEGFDVFLSRRALAFAEMNMDDARAILIADQEEEDDGKSDSSSPASSVQPQEERTDDTVKGSGDDSSDVALNGNQNVKTEPTGGNSSSTLPLPSVTGVGSPPAQMTPPAPAKKSDVVFEAEASQLQELVMESPVPVLIDVYADWCGPCKVLTPALEDVAVKAGGAFRLVKLNTDKEQSISAALQVKALPTVFGVNNGKILNSFEGMPRSEDFMKNFMLGVLMPGAEFDPPLSTEDKAKYADLSMKLAQAVGTASLSFSLRERLQVRTTAALNELVGSFAHDMVDAEESAKVLVSLFSNIVRDPYELKFRRVNLQNKVLAAKVASFPPCISILKNVGFVEDGNDTLVLGKNKKVVNIAPLTVVRNSIDKWIDKHRAEVAKAARKRSDELERARLASERPAEEEDDDEADGDDEEDKDVNSCTLKVRVEGLNKVHEATLDGDEPLSAVLDVLPMSLDEGESVQLTCIAKRLVVKSSDEMSMQKSLREYGLLPAAFIVVKVVGNAEDAENQANTPSSLLAERAASKRNRKKGSHTMQSVGIYSKDDKNKAELIDGGGGTLFEHDVTDDEDEADQEEEEEETKTDDASDTEEDSTENESEL